MTDTIHTIGFIGTGIMGGPMADHLLQAGYALHVHNRTRAKASELCSRGAIWHDDVASLARASDAVITIVGAPPDVEQLYFDAILDHARQGALLIDMTTSSPRLAARIHEAAAAKELQALDAPVSGGQGGAKNASLAIMVGGEENDFRRALPVLEKMGTKIVHCGAAGSGQRMKLSNQILLASNILAVAEALAFADKGKLDYGILLKVLADSTGNSNMLKTYGQKILARDYAPGFFVDHFIKDITIALAEAENLSLDLTSLRNALSRFHEVEKRFSGTDGIQSVARLYFGN
jgi:3-hydroxyisobutyrate dehydrogenase